VDRALLLVVDLERFPFNSSLHPYSIVIPAKAGIYKRLLDAALE
jgi:hypothetical protein